MTFKEVNRKITDELTKERSSTIDNKDYSQSLFKIRRLPS